MAAITSVRAKDALGVLHNAEWHFHARVVATTARAVVTPMFTFLMQADGYNAPEMVQGKWKEWAAAADVVKSLHQGAMAGQRYSSPATQIGKSLY